MVLQQGYALVKWKHLVRSIKHRAQAAVMLLGTSLTACSSADYELDAAIPASSATLPQNDSALALDRPEDPDYPDRGHWGVSMTVPISWEKKDFLQPGVGEIGYRFLINRHGCHGHNDPETCEVLQVCDIDVPPMHVVAYTMFDEHYKNFFPPKLFRGGLVPPLISKVQIKRGKQRIKGTSAPFAIQLGIDPSLPISARWPRSASAIAHHLIDDIDKDSKPGVTVHTLGEQGYKKPPASIAGALGSRVASYFTAVRVMFEWDWVLSSTTTGKHNSNVIEGRARMIRDGDEHAIYQGRVFGCVKENGSACSFKESDNADQLLPTFSGHGVPKLEMKRYNPDVTCEQFLDAN